MKHLIIVGAGGMGREIFNFAEHCIGYGSEYDVKGFLDPDEHILDKFNGYPPVLGEENSYSIQKNDVFICSLGEMNLKAKVVNAIKDKGGMFITLIHETAIIQRNVIIGEGCFIQPFTVIGSDVTIGEQCMIQNHTDIGHDCMIGSFCRIDCKVMLVGGIKVGNYVTIHSSAVINHKVTLCDHTTVGALSFVIRSVKEGQTVFGVPATVL